MIAPKINHGSFFRDLWAVVPYQNPCGYRSRFQNFKIFRENLGVPLLVVEISRTGAFELTPQDADIVIQMVAEDRLWQKECLINIGIQALPGSAQYVAWLDCDIVFETDDWVAEVCDKLRGGFDLVQPFSGVVHQTSEEKAQFPDALDFSKEVSEPSAGLAISQNKFTFSPSRGRSEFSHGHAWCSTRARMEQYPLYDRMICGGGDTINLAAALGVLEVVLSGVHTSQTHIDDIIDHHLTFPKSNISFASTRIFHLYHGAFMDRRYQDRHRILEDANFDPHQHLTVKKNKTLEYTRAGEGLCAKIEAYLHSRYEDEL